jgi:putative methyltransferase
MADSVIRCIPGEDKTNGFFVACFVRGMVESSPEPKRKRSLENESAVVGATNEVEEDGHEDEPDVTMEESGKGEPKPKSAAQLERARRKKHSQQQRKKQKLDTA